MTRPQIYIGTIAELKREVYRVYSGMGALVALWTGCFPSQTVLDLVGWLAGPAARPAGAVMTFGLVGGLVVGARSRPYGAGMLLAVGLLATSLSAALWVIWIALQNPGFLPRGQLFEFLGWSYSILIAFWLLFRYRHLVTFLQN